MIRPKEAVLLCEGFDDRSFWKGWVEHLQGRLKTEKKGGWEEARSLGLHSKRPRKGAQEEESVPGCFTYRTPAGGLLHVIPSQGRRQGERGLPDDVKGFAKIKLLEHSTKRFDRLIINIDVDDSNHVSLRDSVRSLLGHSATETTDGDWALPDGLLVSLLLWHAPSSTSPDPPGVPEKQTLERLVCTAICRAKPAWGNDVHAWLKSRHEPRGAPHKAHGWSYIAGWFADHGPGDYYAAVWREPDIAAELETLMIDIGARRVVDALAALGTTDD